MKNSVKIISVVLVFITLIIGGIYFLNQDSRDIDNNAPSTPPTSVVNATQSPSPTEYQQDIPEDWETYENSDPDYAISYPTEMQAESIQQADVRLLLLGPSQSEGTEMYDGISMTLESGDYEASSFEDFVQQEYQDQRNQPTTSDFSDLGVTTVTDYEGYTFDITSLGTFTHIYLPIDEKNYLHIFYLLEDPEDQGFRSTLDQMLDSIEL